MKKDTRTAALIETLKTRFEANKGRHKGITWQQVETRLRASSKISALLKMESTGGEPDVIGIDKATGEIIFCDCSPETPKERRSLCFDEAARKSRKENKPKGSALGMAKKMGIELLTEDMYRKLQKLGTFDTTTSSWIQTPDAIRKLGGALFSDRRYDTVFTYHNGAESYYAARGFRGMIKI